MYILVFASCLHWAPLRRVWLSRLYFFPSGIYTHWYYTLSLLFWRLSLSLLYRCLHRLSMNSLMCVCIFLVLGSAELDVALQCSVDGSNQWSHQCPVEVKDHPPWSAGSALPNATQDAVDLLLPQGHVAELYSTSCPPRSISAKLLFSQSAPAWTAWGYSSSVSLCWTSCSCQPISPVCQGPSEWQHNHLVY